MNWRQEIDKWLRVSVRREMLDSDLEPLRKLMVGRVLEIGSGHKGRRGQFKPPFSEAESWQYLSLDATQRPDIVADVGEPPLKKGSFDCLLCLEVLEYVKEPAQTLITMRRLLGQDGRLILSVPFMHRIDSSDDYWRFSTHGLTLLLLKAGLRPTYIKNQGAALAVAVNILKYSLHVQEDHRREWRARIARPMLDALLLNDQELADRFSTLASFTTGILCVAVNLPEQGSK